MPEKSQTATFTGIKAERLQAIAFGTLKRLGWQIKFATEKVIIGYTPGKWRKWDEEIIVETNDEQVKITSRLNHGETWDLLGKNKKHISEFAEAFSSVKKDTTDADIANWQEQIVTLKADTIKQTEAQIVEAEEIDKVMGFSSGNLKATYTIIALNFIIFILMVISGINFFAPNPLEVLKWGGNCPAYTLTGQWWRLFACVFLHFGILHLAINMYALYFIGSYLERMLGKIRYVFAYLVAGVTSSMISVLWHKQEVLTVSAGASGAIFGMFGVFLALLTTSIVPKKVKNALMQSVVIFIAFNVFYGLKPESTVDNAAHIGGLLSGMIIGYAYYFTLKNPSENKTAGVLSVLGMITFLVIMLLLRKEELKSSDPFIEQTVKEVNIEDDTPEEKFARLKEHFGVLEELALDAMKQPDSLGKKENLKRLQDVALTDWTECVNLMDEAKELKLPASLDTMRVDLNQYANHRIQQTILIIKAAEENTDKYQPGIDSIQQKIKESVKKIREDSR